MPERMPWIDVLRGVAVVSVVFFHVTLAITNSGLRVDPAMAAVATDLGALRMPVLFTISGLLMTRAVMRGVRDRTLIARVLRSYYFYLLWLVLYFVASLFLSPGTMWRIEGPLDLLTQLFIPDTPLWYLFALSFFAVLLAISRKLPAWLVVGALGAVAVLTGYAPPTIRWWALGSQMFSFGVFFAAGARMPDLIHSISRRPVLTAAAAFVPFVAFRFVAATAPSFVVAVPAGLLESAAVVIVAVGVAQFVALARRASIALSALGRRTLPIYVLHVPMVWILFDQGGIGSAVTPPLGASAPVLLTIALVALALVIEAVGVRVPGATLWFRAHPGLTRLAERLSTRPRRPATDASLEGPITVG